VKTLLKNCEGKKKITIKKQSSLILKMEASSFLNCFIIQFIKQWVNFIFVEIYVLTGMNIKRNECV